MCCVRLSSNLHNFRVRAQPLAKRICQKTFFFAFFLDEPIDTVSLSDLLVSLSNPLGSALLFCFALDSKQNLPVDLVRVFPFWPHVYKNKLFWGPISCPLLHLFVFIVYGGGAYLLFCLHRDRDIFLVSIGHLSRPFVVIYRLPIIAAIHNLCFRFLFFFASKS